MIPSSAPDLPVVALLQGLLVHCNQLRYLPASLRELRLLSAVNVQANPLDTAAAALLEVLRRRCVGAAGGWFREGDGQLRTAVIMPPPAEPVEPAEPAEPVEPAVPA